MEILDEEKLTIFNNNFKTFKKKQEITDNSHILVYDYNKNECIEILKKYDADENIIDRWGNSPNGDKIQLNIK